MEKDGRTSTSSCRTAMSTTWSALPFFAGAYRAGNALRVWSGHQAPAEGTTESAVRSLMSAPLLPIGPEVFAADVSFRDFEAGDVLAPSAGVSVRTARLNHPGGATGYRVEHGGRSICYVTDTEHDPAAPDANVLDLVEGADIMIYDAMFTDEELPRHRGWGHSTWEEGARLCRAAGVATYAILPPRAGPRRRVSRPYRGGGTEDVSRFRGGPRGHGPRSLRARIRTGSIPSTLPRRARFDGTVDIPVHHSPLAPGAGGADRHRGRFVPVPLCVLRAAEADREPGDPGRHRGVPGRRVRDLVLSARVPLHPLRRLPPPRHRQPGVQVRDQRARRAHGRAHAPPASLRPLRPRPALPPASLPEALPRRDHHDESPPRWSRSEGSSATRSSSRSSRVATCS